MDAPTKLDSNLFSATTSFPVTFDDDCADDSTPMIEVMDMSAGDLVSMGGPSVCPWDGSSMTQHSTPSFPRSSLEERFAADLDVDSTAQHERSAATEQASQTSVEPPSEQSIQSRHAADSNGSLLSMRSVGQKRYLATLDELAGLLLPQSCRVAARVSTKLPPLDHDPMLPPLPEGFVLPPEMHPVVGSYTSTKAKTATTGSQTAPAWSAGLAQVTAGQVKDDSHVQGDREGSGKWLHLKQAPPASKAR